MKRLQVCVAVVLVIACASQARAQGKIVWDKNAQGKEYPYVVDLGANGKAIEVKGYLKLDSDQWKVVSVKAKAWINGDKEALVALNIMQPGAPTQWGGNQTHLAPLERGESYHVIVEAELLGPNNIRRAWLITTLPAPLKVR